jgi:hypothetical protein
MINRVARGASLHGALKKLSLQTDSFTGAQFTGFLEKVKRIERPVRERLV